MDSYPELEIDLCFSDRMIDLVQEGFDIAVRIGPLPDTDRLSARRLGQQVMGLAASPAYLQRKGAIESIEDLAAHRGIAYRSNTAQRSRLVSPLILDDLQAVADAAIAGRGPGLVAELVDCPLRTARAVAGRAAQLS